MRGRRWASVFVYLCALSILVPLVAAHGLAARFAEAVAEAQGAQRGGTVAFLDSLELHYLFFLAAFPKIGENLFGEVLNPLRLGSYSFADFANSYALLSNNIATGLVLFFLWMKGRLHLRAINSEWIYLAVITGSLMSVALVIQPRYFYVVYVLLCFEAARVQTHAFSNRVPGNPQGIEYA